MWLDVVVVGKFGRTRSSGFFMELVGNWGGAGSRGGNVVTGRESMFNIDTFLMTKVGGRGRGAR
jgi:hypothetical protein